MDSGIKIEKESHDQIQLFKETKKNPFDYVILQIQEIPDAPAPKGNRSAPEHVIITHKVMKGDSPPGSDGMPPNFNAVHSYFKANQETCAMALLYLEFEAAGKGLQEKLIAINWCPDSASMKLKMRYSSTFKTVCQKAPKINGKIEAHDMDDVEYKTVVSQIGK